MSVDPALGEYIPQAPVNDEAKKANQNLPNGGVYQTTNFHLYHYANNNPINYVDPDGRIPAVAIPFIIKGVKVAIGAYKAYRAIQTVIALDNALTKALDVSPLLQNDSNPMATEGVDSGQTTDGDGDIDMTNPDTWPVPPLDKAKPNEDGALPEGPLTEGDPTRNKPRNRGEKSLYDEHGGQWRPHLEDRNHPETHWDYQPPTDGANSVPEWQNLDWTGTK